MTDIEKNLETVDTLIKIKEIVDSINKPDWLNIQLIDKEKYGYRICFSVTIIKNITIANEIADEMIKEGIFEMFLRPNITAIIAELKTKVEAITGETDA